MTVTEILPMLRALNHADKIRAIQFLANEVAKEEGILFSDNQEHEFHSQYELFDAGQVLLKLLEEQKAGV